MFKVKSLSPYRANVRCPVCLDSKVSQTKARGWFLEKNNAALYYCHNCGLSTNLQGLLRLVSPELYNDYIVDRKMGVTKEIKPSPLETLRTKAPKFTKSPLRNLKKISSLRADHKAKRYVVSRGIPPDKHWLLYYAPDFNEWINSMIPDKLPSYQEERLVIPILNCNKELIGVQGRSLDPRSKIRYITIMLDESHPKVFGYDRVDFSKPFIIVEGPIDSLFLSNAIAMMGSSVKREEIPNVGNGVFVFDFEPRNKAIVDNMSKVLREGYKLAILSPTFTEGRGKDINDLVRSGYKPQVIEAEIWNSAYSGLEGELQLSNWRKV